MNNKPDFASWKPETLARFASEAHDHMKQQDEALAQLRLDLRDAMQLVREMRDARKTD